MKNKQTGVWMKKMAGCLIAMLLMTSVTYGAPGTPTIAKELTLDEAIRMALTNNPSGKIAVFDFEAAKGALTAARSYRWFTISAGGMLRSRMPTRFISETWAPEIQART